MALFLLIRVFCYDAKLEFNFNFIPINNKKKQKKINQITPITLMQIVGTSMMKNRNTTSYDSNENIRIILK